MQTRDHSFAQPCTTFCSVEIKLRGLVNYILLLSLQNLILLLQLLSLMITTNELGAKIRVSQVGRQRQQRKLDIWPQRFKIYTSN